LFSDYQLLPTELVEDGDEDLVAHELQLGKKKGGAIPAGLLPR